MIRSKAPFGAWLVSCFGLLLIYLPLTLLILGSFLKSKNDTPMVLGTEFVWTLDWYRKLFLNAEVLNAFFQSVKVGVWSALGATLIGTSATIGLWSFDFPGKQWITGFFVVPLLLPEIVLGLALLILFVGLKIPLGTFTIIIAHMTLVLSYVVMTVKARVDGLDGSLEEAARDLGASRWQTFWKVTFPLIFPGIASGALIAFTLSFDDFLVTFFTSGVGHDTLPLKIYSMVKFGVSPEINALSTLLLGGSFILALFLMPSFDFNQKSRQLKKKVLRVFKKL